MSNLNYKKIHFIGISGIHVSALAKLMMVQGCKVSGSDIIRSSEIAEELERCNPNLRIHQNATNSPNATDTVCGVDLVVYSDAVPENDLERVAARKLNIPQMSSYEFMGELSQDYWTIAVSGTNGKSTTTAMLGLILEAAGLDPTVIVGTKVKEWGGNLRIGKSKYLVTEADEYKAHMLKLKPQMIVLTNIEEDHLDFYKDMDDIVAHFKKYIHKLPKDGVLVYNEDDCYIAKLLHCFSGKKIGYGVDNGCLKFSQISSNDSNDDETLSIKLRVPGEFNLYNAAGAAAAARALEVSDKVIKKSLEEFRGTWRRFEVVGECKGATVISDYAHHPTALAGTIKAAREFYPGRRLIAVFQPHQHNRTRTLFDDFVSAFAKCEADVIIVSEIYDVAGRTSDEDKKVSSKSLVLEIKKLRNKEIKGTDYDGLKRMTTDYTNSISSPKHFKPQAFQAPSILYVKNLKETRSMIVQTIKPKDVVLIMGAGDIDEVARELVK